jgi:hypothetical protein
MLLVYIFLILYWYVSTMDLYIFYREDMGIYDRADRICYFMIFAMFGMVMYPIWLFRKI